MNPMKIRAFKWWLAVTACLLLLAAPLATGEARAIAESPEVSKVEPPNWWAGQTVGGLGNPLRLLIRGRNLKGATATATKPGVRVSNVKINDAGTYLFADVTISKLARP